MSVDKLVDSTQLDSDLTSVANAIRTKSGGSGQLAFPSGFVSEIGNIPSGGGSSKEEFDVIPASTTDTITLQTGLQSIDNFLIRIKSEDATYDTTQKILYTKHYVVNNKGIAISGANAYAGSERAYKTDGALDWWNYRGTYTLSDGVLTVKNEGNSLNNIKFKAGATYHVELFDLS